jgi:hypothetical protein
VPIYHLHDTTGEDLGLLEHPAPNLEPGDVVVLADGPEAVVTARVDAEPGWGQAAELLGSCLPGDDGPERFYWHIGFNPTGDLDE